MYVLFIIYSDFIVKVFFLDCVFCGSKLCSLILIVTVLFGPFYLLADNVSCSVGFTV